MPHNWEPFDTDLTKALVQIASGPLRRVLLRRHETLHTEGESLSGRAALWLVHQRYKIVRGKASQMDMSKLMPLTFPGGLELYLCSLDAILILLRKEPDEVLLLLAVVEPKHRNAKQFAYEFVFYDRAEPC